MSGSVVPGVGAAMAERSALGAWSAIDTTGDATAVAAPMASPLPGGLCWRFACCGGVAVVGTAGVPPAGTGVLLGGRASGIAVIEPLAVATATGFDGEAR